MHTCSTFDNTLNYAHVSMDAEMCILLDNFSSTCVFTSYVCPTVWTLWRIHALVNSSLTQMWLSQVWQLETQKHILIFFSTIKHFNSSQCFCWGTNILFLDLPILSIYTFLRLDATPEITRMGDSMNYVLNKNISFIYIFKPKIAFVTCLSDLFAVREQCHLYNRYFPRHTQVLTNSVVIRKTSSISRTKYQNLNVSHIVLQLSLPNPLKPNVQLRMKM